MAVGRGSSFQKSATTSESRSAAVVSTAAGLRSGQRYRPEVILDPGGGTGTEPGGPVVGSTHATLFTTAVPELAPAIVAEFGSRRAGEFETCHARGSLVVNILQAMR